MAICLIYGIKMIFSKRWSDILGLCISSGLAAIYSIAIFPSMIDHMFSGYRGEEALENAASGSFNSFIRNLLDFFSIINQDLFGNFGIVVLIFVIISLFVIRDRKFNLMVESVMIYAVVIVKVAGAAIQRYFYPVYGVILFIGLLSIYTILNKLFSRKSLYLVALSVGIITLIGLFSNGWGNLFLFSDELLEFSNSKNDIDCLYIYNERWMIPPSYEEVSNYNSVTYVNSNHLEMLNDLSIISDEELVVIVAGSDIDDVSEQIKDSFMSLDGQYQKIGEYGYAETYYFE